MLGKSEPKILPPKWWKCLMVIYHGTNPSKITNKNKSKMNTVDGRNPKQPPGFVQTLYNGIIIVLGG